MAEENQNYSEDLSANEEGLDESAHVYKCYSIIYFKCVDVHRFIICDISKPDYTALPFEDTQ